MGMVKTKYIWMISFQDPAVVDSATSAPRNRFEQSCDDGKESEESDTGEDEEED